MDLLGLAAPKRSVHAGVDFDGELDQVMSQLVQAFQERDAERGRALADLRGPAGAGAGAGARLRPAGADGPGGEGGGANGTYLNS